MFDSLNLVDTQVKDDNKVDALNSMMSMGGLTPIMDDKKSEFGEAYNGEFGAINNESMMTPINMNNEQFQTPINQEQNIEQFQTPIIGSSLDHGDSDERLGGFSYIENEHNLEIPKFNKNDVDEEEPFSSFKMAGKWIKEAVDLSNYRSAVESMGEEVARYKWAFDQGKMGEFDLKDFSSEMVKSGVRSMGVNTLNMAGNIMDMMGVNLKASEDDINSDSALRKNILPAMSNTFLKLGRAFKDYAIKVEDIEFLAPSEEAYNQDPSFARLANVLGGGASQVLMMGAMSKAIGSVATYGLYSAGSGSEVFNQSYEQDKNLAKANTLAVANAGISFAIDKIFNPLPEVVEKNAKVTAKMIADDMLGAPIKEAGAEILQQMLAENLVRKIGVDDSQDLFEGLIESALGSFMGSTVLIGVNGASYVSNRALEQVHERLVKRGISDEEFELAKNNMLAFMETKSDAFERVLTYNLNKNLKKLEEEARFLQNSSERKKTLNEIKKFDDVYVKMKDRFSKAIGDEKKAELAARLFEANAITLYEKDKSFSPEKYIGGLLPEVKSMEFEEFKKLNLPEGSVFYHFIGPKAKGVDLNKLAKAYKLEQEGVEPDIIWEKTGWVRDGTGMMKMEVSDEGAKNKLFEEIEDDYMHEGITSSDFSMGELLALEDKMTSFASALNNAKDLKYEGFYWDFIKYLDGQNFDDFWENSKFYDEMVDKSLTLEDEKNILESRKKELEKVKQLTDSYDNFKAQDFNDKETKIISSQLEKRKFAEFLREYWGPDDNLYINKFKKLAGEKEDEYIYEKGFWEALAKIEKDYEEKMANRTIEIKEKGIESNPKFFRDIELETAFRYYKVYMGDFSDTKVDMRYHPDSLKEAYKSYKHSEFFLDNIKYRHLPFVRRNELSYYLDVVHELYRMQKQYERIFEADRTRTIRKNAIRNYNVYDKNSTNRRILKAREFMKVQNGMIMKLSDILEHDLLYENYPDLKDVKVSFTEIEDDEPYHFYFNRDEGYVLEIDANQIDFENFKNVFLLGANFVIQDIEGFDYSLNRYQQKNFMDRELYTAKNQLSYFIIGRLEEFVDDLLPDEDYKNFIITKDMPVSLLGLSHSMAKGSHNKKVENITYPEIDFDRLEVALKKKYMKLNSGDSSYIVDFVYIKLADLKNDIINKVTTYTRNRSGYHALGFPWAGITAQGSIDARAILKQGRWGFYDDIDSDLTQDNSQQKKAVTNYALFDKANVHNEFDSYNEYDESHLSETIDDLAKGAYDEANKTILLFKNADVETIFHETFHYFSDIVEKANLRKNLAFVDYFNALDILKEGFLSNYNIRKSDNGLYFAYDELNDEIVDFMPIGFASQDALVEAGARELMVDRITRMAKGKLVDPAGDDMYEGIWLFCRWLKNVTKMLGIDGRKVGKGGHSAIKFISKKLKKMSARERREMLENFE